MSPATVRVSPASRCAFEYFRSQPAVRENRRAMCRFGPRAQVRQRRRSLCEYAMRKRNLETNPASTARV